VPEASSITGGVVAIVVEKKKQRRRNMKNSVTACNEFILNITMKRYVEGDLPRSHEEHLYIHGDRTTHRLPMRHGWSDPAPVTAPVPFEMNQCSYQLLNLPQLERSSQKKKILILRQSIVFHLVLPLLNQLPTYLNALVNQLPTHLTHFAMAKLICLLN
jgi:hypothetical protein